MKAVFYYSNTDIRVEETKIPAVTDDELLVKMHVSGICGSDVLWDYRKSTVEQSIKTSGKGLVLGHEIAGEIVQAGERSGFKSGERVCIAHHVPCGDCDYCRDGHETGCNLLRSTNVVPGGFAEYIKVPSINSQKGIYRLPDHISYESGSLIEPLGCAIRGQRFAKISKNTSTLIIGLGAAGIFHLKLAKTVGVRDVYVSDINEYRLKLAEQFGGIRATDKVLVNRVIICSAAPQAFEQALQCIDRGGVILYFAAPKSNASLQLPFSKWRDEVSIVTSYGAAPCDMTEALRLVSEKRINIEETITHKIQITNAPDAFKLVINPSESLKVVIRSEL